MDNLYKGLKLVSFLLMGGAFLHIFLKAWESKKRPWSTVALLAGLILALTLISVL